MTPRRQRINRIRKRTAVFATSLFLALFAGVAVQMETGHDPALGAQQTPTQSSSTTVAATTSSSSAATPTLSPATTSQS